jgi:hypothetical protein
MEGWGSPAAVALGGVGRVPRTKNLPLVGVPIEVPFNPVTGLSASTADSFTVEATDAHGTSGPGSSMDVTALANSCAIKPSAQAGSAASGTTSSGTSLSWTADTAPANCTISTLLGIAERDFDRNPNRDIIRRERSCGFGGFA